MRIVAQGQKGGQRVRHTWEVFDRYDPQSGLRSMFRTTGFAATSMPSLMARGVVKEPGVYPPELLGMKPGVTEAFLAEYQRRGVEVTHRTSTP